MQSMVDRVRTLEPIDADIPVMVAGDPEKYHQQMRIKSGIPIEEEKYTELIAVNAEFSSAVIR
jgi:LDH2 family malate/lactate/ureidoglycolate dehydrogenase